MNLVGTYTCTYCKCRVTLCAGLLQCRLVDLGISCTVAVFCVVASSGVPGLLHSLLHCPAAAATLEGSAGILSGARSWERFAGGWLVVCARCGCRVACAVLSWLASADPACMA